MANISGRLLLSRLYHTKTQEHGNLVVGRNDLRKCAAVEEATFNTQAFGFQWRYNKVEIPHNGPSAMMVN